MLRAVKSSLETQPGSFEGAVSSQLTLAQNDACALMSHSPLLHLVIFGAALTIVLTVFHYP